MQEGRKRPTMPLEFEALTEQIIGAAIEVHRRLGPGFLESIYEKALIIDYDGEEVGRHRLDLLVEGTIVVELKAVKNFEDVHFAVVRSYLKALGRRHGLLLNFAKI